LQNDEDINQGIASASNRETFTFQEGDWKRQVGKMKRGIKI